MREEPDRLAVEEPLEIRLGGRRFTLTMRTPGHDEELAAGFLLAEGFINNREELGEIDYEISVLSPLRRVLDVDEIVVGRDGLLVKNGGYEGLLLPQVAEEYGWDRIQFVEQTCVKAGLSRDAWKDEGTDIFRFHAIVFHEE